MWDRACECSTVNSAQRKTAKTWPEPDFVIRYKSGQPYAFHRNHNPAHFQLVSFKGVFDHDDWQPVKPKSAVDMLGSLA